MTILLGVALYFVIGFVMLWIFEKLEIDSLPGSHDAGCYDDLSKGLILLAWWMPILVWIVTCFAKLLIWIYDSILDYFS